MGKRILFAVMALFVMATGSVWAQTQGEGGTTTDGSTAYVVNYNGTLYFLCNESAELKAGDRITIGEKEVTLTEGDFWKGDAVLNTGTTSPGWMYCNSYVNSVVIDASFASARPKSCQERFEFYGNLTTLDLSNLNTEYVENMSHMFMYCNKLTSLDLKSFDTSKVTTFNNMFCGCKALTSLDLSSFNTTNVTDIAAMFYNCEALTSLNLSNFNMSSVTNITNMFTGCTALNMLDLSNATGTSIKTAIGQLNGNPVIYVTDASFVPENKNFNVVVCNDESKDFIIDGSGDKALNIPFSFHVDKVTVKRTFAAEKPHTVFLPFAIKNATSYGKFYKYSGYDEENGTLKFGKLEENEATEANKPYLFIPTEEGIEEITITSDDADIEISATTDLTTTDNDAFIGVYEKKAFGTDIDLNGDYDYYGWTSTGDGEFRKAGNGAFVNPCRAYVRLEKEATGNNAPALLAIQLGGDTTGITSAEIGADGGEDAPVYNLQGQCVGSSYKGVAIKNGKKMIIK